MDDLLFRATVASARRLLKNRLRLMLFRLRSTSSEEDMWAPLIHMEEEFEEQAQQAWSKAKACWVSGPVSSALQEMAVQQAMQEARDDLSEYMDSDNGPGLSPSHFSELQ